jgi:collagenase-like PrtC family protease
LKFAVGYQLHQEGEITFADIVRKHSQHIAEVYFPWLDGASGRSSLTNRRGYVDWEGQTKLISDLRFFKSLGIKLDLLFNGNCYGAHAMSQYLANNVASILDFLGNAIGGVDIITTTSPAIAHIIKENYPGIEIHSSVNMRIGTVKGMEYVAHLYDSFYIQREYNRDLDKIEELKEWADANGKKLLMLANSGCMNFCSGQTFHDNMVAHGNEIEEIEKIPGWNPHMCWNYLKAPENWVSVLQNSWIRPEDLHQYEKYFNIVKLATRMHALPGMVIEAYTRGKYYGNLLDLFEPGFGPSFAPYVIDNTKFPEDWFEKTTKCSKKCHKCDYCKGVLNQVVVDSEAY